jgi:phosphonate transport system substrate-binding protein
MAENTEFFCENVAQYIQAKLGIYTEYDSTILEWALGQNPEIAEQMRVVATFGPSPMPPWVISGTVSVSLRSELCALLLSMHRDRSGRRILARASLDRFVEARDHDYDPIRIMARKAEQVSLA